MVLSKNEVRKLEAKIAALEKLTSAEIKVIISDRSWFGIRTKAKSLFRKFNLDRTKERNAVLFLVLVKDRQILIYGDTGIHQRVETDGWELICTEVLQKFKQDEYLEGIALGIHLIADSLIQHFPSSQENANEVSNEIIFDN